MPPVAAANPSPASPAAAVGTVVPVPMVDLLHFCLCIFVKGRCLWRLKFVEDAASGSWNTRYCVDWADSACKGRCPGNTKHCSQEGSPIHNKPPKVPELKRARCRMSSPAHGEYRTRQPPKRLTGPISAGRDVPRRSTSCQPRTIPITRKVMAVAKIGASNHRAWPTLFSTVSLRVCRDNNLQA